jgi:hypothetical protein
LPYYACEQDFLDGRSPYGVRCWTPCGEELRQLVDRLDRMEEVGGIEQVIGSHVPAQVG